MKTPHWRARLVLVALASAAAVGLVSAQSSQARAQDKPIARDTPAVVAQGKAKGRGHHDGNAVLQRQRRACGSRLGRARRADPGGERRREARSYGHYLTNAQYLASYAPDGRAGASRDGVAEEPGTQRDGRVAGQPARSTCRRRRSSSSRRSASRSTTTRRTVASFHSNDRDPTVPAGLDVSWVSGLVELRHLQAGGHMCDPAVTRLQPRRQRLHDGYDVVGDGKGRRSASRSGATQLPQSDFTGYATATGTTRDHDRPGRRRRPRLHHGRRRDDRDRHRRRGRARHAERARHRAGRPRDLLARRRQLELDARGRAERRRELEHLDHLEQLGRAVEPLLGRLEHGDARSSTERRPARRSTSRPATPARPAAARTRRRASTSSRSAAPSLNITTPGDTYNSESAVNNGGGCLDSRAASVVADRNRLAADSGARLRRRARAARRPTWPRSRASARTARTAVRARSSSSTARPRAASAARASQRRSGRPRRSSGTTTTKRTDDRTSASSRPLIYALANDPTTYARDFHDVTTGTNGFAATTGWDEATGWGSADFNKLANNPSTSRTPARRRSSKGDTITLSATLLDHGASTTLATAALGTLKVSLAAGRLVLRRDRRLERARVVQRHDHATTPGTYTAIAAYAGDAAYVGGSQTVDFVVQHIPTKITYSGDTSGDYNDPVDADGEAHGRQQPDVVLERRPDRRRDAPASRSARRAAPATTERERRRDAAR